LNTEEKKILTWRVAVIAGIFSAIVSIIMLLNYWQLRRTEPLENELLLSLVEQIKKDSGNEQLKEDIRRLDLMVRKAYFTKQWQIRAGAFMLIGGVIVLMISLRLYHSFGDEITEPGTEDRHLKKELLATQHWIIYSILAIFCLALVAAYLSNDQLSNTYALTSPDEEEQDAEVEEIMIRTQDDKMVSGPGLKESETEIPNEENLATVKEGEILENKNGEIADTGEASKVAGNNESLNYTDQFPAFRGPFGLGKSYHKGLPIDWDGASGNNILWKSRIPLPGFNSPVIWGDKIFLTGASTSEQFIYCFNRTNGELIWQHQVNNIRRSSSAVPRVTDDTGYAAPTVTTDGNSVCAIFATGDIVCVDMLGKRRWAKNLGVPDNHYGHSSSLLTYKNMLLVQFDTNKEGKVLALEISTGEQKWTTSRTSKISWASPILADLGDHVELILASSPHVAAYDPVTGEELWALECLMGEVGPSPAYDEGVVYATNEYAVLAAIKPGGTPMILWESNEYLPEVASPTVDDGMVFIGTSYGVIACYDALNGEILWEYECDDGIYASPMIADNKVYFLDMRGKMHIFNKDRTMKLLGEPELGENTVSTPSFSDNRIYLRSDEFLYCIGK
jgi:outer membrane protein assembly factor BamB